MMPRRRAALGEPAVLAPMWPIFKKCVRHDGALPTVATRWRGCGASTSSATSQCVQENRT